MDREPLPLGGNGPAEERMDDGDGSGFEEEREFPREICPLGGGGIDEVEEEGGVLVFI